MGRDPSWRQRRTADAQARADALQTRRATERDKATALLRRFVAEATARGLEPVALTARGYSGRGRFRTDVRGWYIRRNRSLAVGTDGGFYTLTVPGSLRARLVGVHLEPSDAPLVVGAGGRDGESIALADLLRQRLEAGDAWP